MIIAEEHTSQWIAYWCKDGRANWHPNPWNWSTFCSTNCRPPNRQFSSVSLSPTVCGTQPWYQGSLIVGGQYSPPGKWTWIEEVSRMIFWVLTTSHCFKHLQRKELSVHIPAELASFLLKFQEGRCTFLEAHIGSKQPLSCQLTGVNLKDIRSHTTQSL